MVYCRRWRGAPGWSPSGRPEPKRWPPSGWRRSGGRNPRTANRAADCPRRGATLSPRAFILTLTEMTAGFTFSTMSAKPTGRCAVCACGVGRRKQRLPVDLDANAEVAEASRRSRGRPTVASRTTRRFGQQAMPRRTGCIRSHRMMAPFRCGKASRKPRAVAAIKNGERSPYRILTARLNFGNLPEPSKTLKNFVRSSWIKARRRAGRMSLPAKSGQLAAQTVIPQALYWLAGRVPVRSVKAPRPHQSDMHCYRGARSFRRAGVLHRE